MGPTRPRNLGPGSLGNPAGVPARLDRCLQPGFQVDIPQGAPAQAGLNFFLQIQLPTHGRRQKVAILKIRVHLQSSREEPNGANIQTARPMWGESKNATWHSNDGNSSSSSRWGLTFTLQTPQTNCSVQTNGSRALPR